jgi:hypothetical protein
MSCIQKNSIVNLYVLPVAIFRLVLIPDRLSRVVIIRLYPG